MTDVPSAPVGEVGGELSGVEAKVHPGVSAERRAELGAGSARSLLLTMLGEFAFPAGRVVWTSTLIEGLGALGVEEKSARQAIARASAEGLLTSDRVGRRTRWTMTDSLAELLREGTERIYSFQSPDRDWDGRWLVLSVAVPETQRKLRHRLRTQLTWLGMGSPAPGLWVVPDTGVVDQVRDVLETLGLRATAFVWAGRWVEVGEREALITAAWDLAEIAERYREFLEVFHPSPVPDATAAFVAQMRLVQAWRRFPFLDPDLPVRLLPQDWPGAAARQAFHRCHDLWHDDAQRAWRGWVPQD